MEFTAERASSVVAVSLQLFQSDLVSMGEEDSTDSIDLTDSTDLGEDSEEEISMVEEDSLVEEGPLFINFLVSIVGLGL